MLKLLLTVLLLLAFSYSFAFDQPFCDQSDQAWDIITHSKPIPPSNHFLLHNGRIIRKDILNKLQRPAFRYIPEWKAFEEAAIGYPTKTYSATSTKLSATSTKLSATSTKLSANADGINETLAASDNGSASQSETISAPATFLMPHLMPQEPPHLPAVKKYVKVKMFHWHLEADTHSSESTGQMTWLLANLKQRLASEKLKPDVFAFTGTNSITGKGAGAKARQYVEELCQTLWQYHFGKKAPAKTCQMEKHKSGKHHLCWTEHMLVISMVPAEPFKLAKFGDYENCGTYDDPYASYLLLDLHYNNQYIPTMFFSSLDETVKDSFVAPETWDYCSNQLKTDIEGTLDKNQTMIIISHVNTPYFTHQDLARHFSAKVRNIESVNELSPKFCNTCKQGF